MRVITVGRASDNDVVIQDPKVSRHHAQIVQQNDGCIYLIDLESSNGTFVNGNRIYGRHYLHIGDSVKVYHHIIDWQKYFESKKEKNSLWVIVLTILGILGVMGAIIYFINDNEKHYAYADIKSHQYSQAVGSRSNIAGNTISPISYNKNSEANNNSSLTNENNAADTNPSSGYDYYNSQEARQSLPTLQQLKSDLIGRRLSEPQPGYHGQDWCWVIEAGEIQNISIKNQYYNGNSYVYSLDLSLHAIDGTGVTHRFVCDFIYTKHGDNWMPSVLKSKELEIVRTYLYDDCITSEKKGWPGEYEIEFTNNCDIDLVVGGICQLEYSNKGWQKFSCVVPANSKKSIGGLFIGSIEKYKIHFVERGD